MTPTRKDRIIGGLLGVHAGDSLGATLEFDSWESIKNRHPAGIRDIVGGGPFQWPAGHATDDTDLTRAVLLAYRDREAGRRDGDLEGFDIGLVAGKYMLDWFDGEWPDREPGSQPVDVGFATSSGLEMLRRTGDPRKAGAGPGSAGNGSLMRCIPTALFGENDASIVEDSILISGITHNDTRCTVACAAYNIMARALLHDATPAEAMDAGLATAKALWEAKVPGRPNAVGEAIELGGRLSLQELAENGPAPLPGKASGYVLESLTLAVAALLDPRPLVDVLVDVIRIGKDTDTNGAIAGGLLGVRDGVGALSSQWRPILQFGDEFEEMVTEMLGE